MNSAEIKHTRIKGKQVSFYCPHPDDHIIQYHLSGHFYEDMELDLIQKLIPDQASILDVGSNVGNHILYYALFMNPRSITWVEPNPVSIDVLEQNLLINQIADKVKVIGNPGIAFSDKPGRGEVNFYPKNIGGARVNELPEGAVNIVVGDEYLKNKKYDFIKLDTEIQDIEALKGLKMLIRATQPMILIEIFDSRLSEFSTLLDRFNYRIHFAAKRYRLNTNYFIVPKK